MQRQDHVPFLSQPTIFMGMARHLTPAAIKNLEQTCTLARARVETFLNDPVQVLLLLGNLNREQAAQFFNLYRHFIGVQVTLLLNENPNHHAAYTLYAMMCSVKPDMLDVNRLSEAIAYLEENHFSKRVRDSLLFLISVLWAVPADKFKQLLMPAQEFYINLRHADLGDTVLTDCDMRGADLCGASLFSADMSRTDLSFADLTGVDASDADFKGVNFVGANLQQMKDMMGFPHQPCTKNAKFFSSSDKKKVKKALDRFQNMRDLPGFALEGIVDHFTNMNAGESHEQELERLEKSMTHPLFATHTEIPIAFINRYLFTIFTAPQADISRRIHVLKQLIESKNRGAEPPLKKAK